MVKTARAIKIIRQDKGLFQVLFELDYPIKQLYYDKDKETINFWSYVISSATLVFKRPETYLFPASSKGEFMNMSELYGSLKDVYDVTEPLKQLGYEVIISPAFKVLYEIK